MRAFLHAPCWGGGGMEGRRVDRPVSGLFLVFPSFPNVFQAISLVSFAGVSSPLNTSLTRVGAAKGRKNKTKKKGGREKKKKKKEYIIRLLPGMFDSARSRFRT